MGFIKSRAVCYQIVRDNMSGIRSIKNKRGEVLQILAPVFGAIITATMFMVAIFIDEDAFGEVFAALCVAKVGLLSFFAVIIKCTFKIMNHAVVEVITNTGQGVL